jgi:hypothetical protein
LTKLGERDAAQCLHDTINHLNRNQIAQLIRFTGDGTGKGVRWEVRIFKVALSYPTGPFALDSES